MWAAIAAAIAGLFSNLMGSVLGYQSNRETNQANRDLAAQQNQWNVEQWQRQTDYNTPANQVARLAAANINPALAMANGGLVDAGNAGDIKGINPIPMLPYDPSSSFSALSGQLMNLPMQQSQIKLQDSTSRLQDAQTQETMSKIPVNEQSVLNQKMQSKEIEQGIKNMEQQLVNLQASKDLIDSQKSQTEIATFNDRLRTFSQLLNDSADRQLTQQKVNESIATVNYLSESINKLQADEQYVSALADQIELAVKNGNAEFATKYGSTKAEIESSIRRYYQVAQNELEKMRKETTWTASNAYQLMMRAYDVMQVVFYPISQATGAVSNTLHGVGAVK